MQDPTNEETVINNDDYILRLATSQAMQFKMLFDVLKDLLTEVNFNFDKEGFKVISMDPGKIGMIHLSIHNIEEYYCSRDKIHVGLLIPYLYKILRSVNTCYHMEWALRKDEPTILQVILSNADRRLRTTHRVNILQLDIEEITIPAVEFDHVICMPSSDLQRYIKELSHVANTLTIKTKGRNIFFVSKGDLGETSIEITPTPAGMNWLQKKNNADKSNEEEEDFQSTFFLKYLERFTKSQVDSRVEIYLKKHYPVILRYEMAVGSLKFAVAPIRDQAPLDR